MAYEGRYARKRRDSDEETPKRTSPFGQFLDNHVRLIAALCTVLAILLVFVGIEVLVRSNLIGGEKEDGKAMTMNYLNALSTRNGALYWDDFRGISYETVSSNKSEEGTYVLRRYKIDGEVLSLLVGGYVEGEAFTGTVAYAEVKHRSDFDFSFSLLEDDDLLGYLEKYSPKKGN